MKIFNFFIVSILLLSSCSGKNDDTDPIVTPSDYDLELSRDEIRFGYHGSFYSIVLTSEVEWTYENDEDWCTVYQPDFEKVMEVKITVEENTHYTERTDIITFSNGHETKTLKIIQNAKPTPYLTLPREEINFNKSAGYVDLPVRSNVSWQIRGGAEWLELGNTAGTNDWVVRISVEPYGGDTKRETTLTFYSGNDLSKDLKVIQTADEQVFVEFDDQIFKNFCLENFDQNGDGEISTFEAEQVEYMYCQNYYISSLKGIEYFTSLVELSCVNNSLTRLDISANTKLHTIRCGDNFLEELIVGANSNLIWLYAGVNKLASIDLSQCPALFGAFVDANELTSIDVTKNTELRTLSVSDNKIESLNLSQNKLLYNLSCSYNNIANLDLTNNPDIEIMNLSENPMTELDLTMFPKLRVLTTNKCGFTSLDISKCERLNTFRCQESDALQTLYVWPGFDLSKMSAFHLPEGVNIVERN